MGMKKYTVEAHTSQHELADIGAADAPAPANLSTTDGELPFRIRAREGDEFVAIDGTQVGVHQWMLMLNGDVEEHRKSLSMLGIDISERMLHIVFNEKGKPYADPENDRSKVTAEPEVRGVEQDLNIDHEIPEKLNITYVSERFCHDGINFFGSLQIQTPHSGERFIPLTGRGTIALEGRLNDAHAGLCTGAACASFQNRCAVVLAVAAAAGASENQILLVGDKLMQLNGAFHGRDDILRYTIECAVRHTRTSYMDWMTAKYERAGPAMPPQLECMIRTGKPHPVYWDKVRQKFTEEELQEDNVVFTQTKKIIAKEKRKNCCSVL